jgi:hypothetical protein
MFYEAMVTINGLLRPGPCGYPSSSLDLSGKMDRFPRTYHEIIAELEAEIELLKSQQHAENEKLNTAVKHECKNNEKLNATLRHEREENERLNAALKFALLENANLIELTRSLRAQADGLDGLRAVLEIIADEINAKKRRRRLLAPNNTSGPSLLPHGAPAHP